MLAIRLQRIGRTGYPVYRLAVQQSQKHPSSGRVVSYVGSYNPHSKAVTLNTDKIDFYLKHGAQPTDRVVKILQGQKVSLPAWVKVKESTGSKSIKNPDKLRKNRPTKEKAEVPAEPETTEERPTEVESSDSTDEAVVEQEAPTAQK